MSFTLESLENLLNTKMSKKKEKEVEGIVFQSVFSKATTTVDGGWNITFSVSQDDANKVTLLSNFRDVLLQLAVVPIEQDDLQ